MPNFPINPLPIPRAPQVQVQPPPFVDPAGIIMQAAALRQQRDLAHQKMQQELAENLSQTMMTAASLAEQKRQHSYENAIAEAQLNVAQGKAQAEAPLLAAHAQAMEQQGRLYEAQANALSGAGNGYADSMQKVHEGKMAPSQFFDGFSNRQNLKASMQALYNQLYPNDNIAQLENQYTQSKAAAQTAGGTQVQIPQAMAKGVEALTVDLADRAQKVGLTNYPAINKGIIALKTMTGDPDMKDYLLRNVEARKQLSQVFAGSGVPTDFASKAADEVLPPETGVSAMKMVNSSTIPSMVGARIGALQSIGPSGMNAPAAMQTAPKAQRVRVKAPNGMIGTISPENLQEALGNGYQQLQ